MREKGYRERGRQGLKENGQRFYDVQAQNMLNIDKHYVGCANLGSQD